MLCAMVECVSVGRSGAVLSREVLSIGQTVINAVQVISIGLLFKSCPFLQVENPYRPL